MKVRHAIGLLQSTVDNLRGRDPEMVLEDVFIEEILSTAEGLISEARAAQYGETEFVEPRDWHLRALAVGGYDEEFNTEFRNLCKKHCESVAVLYSLACTFFYRSLRRPESKEKCVLVFRSITEGILREDVVDAILRKLKANNVLN